MWFAAASAVALSIGRFLLGRSKKKSEKREGKQRKKRVGWHDTYSEEEVPPPSREKEESWETETRDSASNLLLLLLFSFTLLHINVVFLVFYPILDFFPLFHLLHQISFFQARFAIP